MMLYLSSAPLIIDLKMMHCGKDKGQNLVLNLPTMHQIGPFPQCIISEINITSFL